MNFLKNMYTYFFVELTSLNCPRGYVLLAIVFVVVATQAFKLPIKKFLFSKIKNKTTQKKLNSLFTLLAIGLGVLVSLVYHIALKFDFSVEAGITIGISSATLYEFATRIFARIKNGEDLTAETISLDLADSANTVNDDVVTATTTVAETIDVVTSVVQTSGSTEETKAGGKLEEAIEKITKK
jgi:hypothetical protein